MNTYFPEFCRVDGVNYPFNDITDFPVYDILQCELECWKNPSCRLYAFLKSQKHCWLKSSKNQAQAATHGDVIMGFQNYFDPGIINCS